MDRVNVAPKVWFALLLALMVGLIAAPRGTLAAPGTPGLSAQATLGSGFTFHGQLTRSGAAYTGACDFTFSLWDAAAAGAQIGATQTVSGVAVSGGVFAVVLNAASEFGANAFGNSARWLNTEVRCTGDAAPSDMGRQALLATPYTLYAVTAGAVSADAGSSLVSALNNAATTGQISAARLSANAILFNPTAPQISIGDGNGTAPMLSLRGGSTCCSPPGGYTPADFKVFQNGSFVATGNLGIGVSPLQGKGYRTSWDSYKGAFRSGYADAEWDNANVGFFSWAGGSNSTASGLYALAFGDTNQAESTSSIAFGSGNQVKGAAGISAGAGNRVCDTYGVAFGNKAQSGGPLISGKCDPDTFNIRGLAAVAIGYNVTADQDHTMALGKFASNNGFSGTFVWSDGSATASADTFRNTANNEFAARATGGFRFRTNLAGTTGCNLPAGSGVFACTSDRNEKENFAALDGEAVLAKLGMLAIDAWNYKTDPTKNTHVGPTAQDFYAAFGLGGSDKEIGLLDVNGIALLGIQALERRTSTLETLSTRVAELESEKATAQQRLSTLEAEKATDQRRLASLEERLAAIEHTPGGAPAQRNWGWLVASGLFGALLVLGAQQLGVIKRRV